MTSPFILKSEPTYHPVGVNVQSGILLPPGGGLLLLPGYWCAILTRWQVVISGGLN